MIEVQLPWPSSVLSPNSRVHWSLLSRHRHNYRKTCAILTRQQIRTAICPEKGWHAILVFCRPTRRSYDRDNLLARMKAGLDGVCDALGFDDSQIAVITAAVARDPSPPEGHVHLCLTYAQDP